MPLYERGPVRIHYEEVGSGFPARAALEKLGAAKTTQ